MFDNGGHFKPGARKSRGVVHLIGWPRNGTRFSAPGSVRIHYLRKNADYAGWTIYDWTGAKNPSPSWQNPGTPPPVSDDFGVYWDIALADGATRLLFIVRNADGSVKNCQSDMVLDISKGLEIWLRQDDCNMADFNQAIKINPKYAAAYRNRGDAKRKKGDVNGAITDFNRAVKLGLQSADVAENPD